MSTEAVTVKVAGSLNPAAMKAAVARLMAEREADGHPPTVTDPAALAKVARVLKSGPPAKGGPQRFSGSRLRGYRERGNLTREQLATATGRCYESIASYELGRAVPSLGTLTQLAFVLGVDIGDLFDPGLG